MIATSPIRRRMLALGAAGAAFGLLLWAAFWWLVIVYVFTAPITLTVVLLRFALVGCR